MKSKKYVALTVLALTVCGNVLAPLAASAAVETQAIQGDNVSNMAGDTAIEEPNENTTIEANETTVPEVSIIDTNENTEVESNVDTIQPVASGSTVEVSNWTEFHRAITDSNVEVG